MYYALGFQAGAVESDGGTGWMDGQYDKTVLARDWQDLVERLQAGPVGLRHYVEILEPMGPLVPGSACSRPMANTGYQSLQHS